METKGVGAEVREWMLAKRSMKGHKKRVDLAMSAIDDAMVADRTILVGTEVIAVADHRVRLMGAGLVVSIYGLEAEKRTKLTMAGDPDAPLLINLTDRRYIEGLITSTQKVLEAGGDYD